jgi:hypothetical protein
VKPLFVAWLASAVVLASCCFRPPDCEIRQVLSQAPSPDGAWVATVYFNVCGACVTSDFYSVEVTPPDEPATPMPEAGRTVFGMDYSGAPKPFAVRWTAQRSLEITIPNDARAAKQEEAFADMTISYKYVPDDPAERACLRKWYSQSIDEQVRRNLSPNENLKVFVAKCRAEGGPH